jgi:HsdM N-terminal domain
MTLQDKEQLGKTLWNIADQLRGAMNADDFRDYMLAFLFLRYLSDNYEAAAQKELGSDYPILTAEDRRAPLTAWYEQNPASSPSSVPSFGPKRGLVAVESAQAPHRQPDTTLRTCGEDRAGRFRGRRLPPRTAS